MKKWMWFLITGLVFGGFNGLLTAKVANPELFFSRDDLPTLRTKVETPAGQEFYEIVQYYADRYMDLGVDPYETDGPYSGRNLQSHVATLAFAGGINEDVKYLNKAKAVFLAALNQWTVQDLLGFNGHLALGDAAWAYAIGYDWLAAAMTDEELLLAKTKMHELGEALLHDSTKRPAAGPPEPVGSLKRSRVAHNHQVVIHAGLMLLGMLLDEEAWVDHSIPRLRGYMRYTQDGTGAPFEGVGYADYGLCAFALAHAAHARRTGEDLSEGIEGPDLMLNYLMHHVAPWDGEVVPICQTDYGLTVPAGYFYLTQNAGDSLGLWAWHRALGEKGVAFLKEPTIHTSLLKMLPFYVLWSDAAVQPQSPDVVGAPLSARFRRGQASMRSGWDDDAALVTFNAGEGLVGIWDHPDETQFTYYSRGSKFILDCGAYMFGPGSHGVMLVDGKGQIHAGAGHATQGRVTAFEERGDSVFVAGDATDAYTRDVWGKGAPSPVRHVKRKLLFVREPEPFLVLVDDVEANDFAEHSFASRLFYADKYTPNTVELKNSDAFRITGNPSGAVAEVRCLWPQDITLNRGRFEGNNGRYGKYVDMQASGKALRMITVFTAHDSPEKLPKATLTPREDDIAFDISLTFDDGRTAAVYIDQQDMETDVNHE